MGHMGVKTCLTLPKRDFHVTFAGNAHMYSVANHYRLCSWLVCNSFDMNTYCTCAGTACGESGPGKSAGENRQVSIEPRPVTVRGALVQLGHRIGLKNPTRNITETLALDLDCSAAMALQALRNGNS